MAILSLYLIIAGSKLLWIKLLIQNIVCLQTDETERADVQVLNIINFYSGSLPSYNMQEGTN